MAVPQTVPPDVPFFYPLRLIELNSCQLSLHANRGLMRAKRNQWFSWYYVVIIVIAVLLALLIWILFGVSKAPTHYNLIQ